MVRRISAVCISSLVVACAISALPATATAATERPVVVVAGTFGPAFFYEPLAGRLRADGRRVAVFQLTGLGTADIRVSARDLDRFVDDVRAAAGASQVDLVAHSQGGLVARQYIKNEGGAREVANLVNLSAPNRGTVVANIADFFGGGDCLRIVACQQMKVGSTFLEGLNAGDDTVGAVRYTNLYTGFDALVRPIDNARMSDGATNVLVQSQCPYRAVVHLGMPFDGAVYSGVQDALQGRQITLDCFRG
ncbi:alpha/beta fold hydrolase [Lentzea sp. HUAS12]|uniref:lipase family alpha/beta hydrolase n=1 Tax=Lentzea sp. HUAS12 TaxID=2951806 RepID=UPI00209E601C|nr:alpha/beta fold hydrolase [Lentzea sp. HUAS12]USX54411.1 alpha/beta fold hydrolase [Lentzea sp. HUAS12]